MHFHCEIVIPPTSNIDQAIDSVMSPFCEHYEDTDDEDLLYSRRKYGFWDCYTIGGRWSGAKCMASIPEADLERFYAWLKDEKVTVSGITAGKHELSPATQIEKVDAKWREIFPQWTSQHCPIFKHASNQYAKGSAGTLPGDIQAIAEVHDLVKCDRVIFCAPAWESRTQQYTGNLHSKWMTSESMWNGCNHVKTGWDGTFKSALKEYLKYLENYADDAKAKMAPASDWLAVTVDYHS